MVCDAFRRFRSLRPRSVCLAIVWTVLAVVWLVPQVSGQDLGRLRERLGTAIEAEQWQKALAAALEIVKLDPANRTSHYNAGCVLALMGEGDAAIEALGQATKLGFSALATMRDDPDLESVRSHPGYAAVFQGVEANDAQESAAFKKRADEIMPLIFLPPDAETGDGPRPLIVALHGRGGRAENFARLFRPSAEKIGAVLVVPEALDPFGIGFQWRRLDDSLYLIARAIELAADRQPIDRRQVILAGFSQGAHLSLNGAIRDPSRYAGVLAIGACDRRGFGLEPPDGQELPPIYIGVGSEDRVYDDCRPMAKQFESTGFKVKFRVYKGYGHVFPQNYKWEIDRALRFVLDAGS